MLVGVTLSRPSRSAILAVAGGRSVVVVQGQHVGAFVVLSIGPDTVTLLGANGEQVLHLAFLRSGGGLAAPAPFQQPPRAAGPLPGLPAVRFGPNGLPIADPRVPS